MVNPTTPTFLSDPEAPPPTNPVVYSPVPTMRTSKALDEASFSGAGVGWLEECRGSESILYRSVRVECFGLSSYVVINQIRTQG